jgi:hypothetical protein
MFKVLADRDRLNATRAMPRISTAPSEIVTRARVTERFRRLCYHGSGSEPVWRRPRGCADCEGANRPIG